MRPPCNFQIAFIHYTSESLDTDIYPRPETCAVSIVSTNLNYLRVAVLESEATIGQTNRQTDGQDAICNAASYDHQLN